MTANKDQETVKTRNSADIKIKNTRYEQNAHLGVQREIADQARKDSKGKNAPNEEETLEQQAERIILRVEETRKHCTTFCSAAREFDKHYSANETGIKGFIGKFTRSNAAIKEQNAKEKEFYSSQKELADLQEELKKIHDKIEEGQKTNCLTVRDVKDYEKRIEEIHEQLNLIGIRNAEAIAGLTAIISSLYVVKTPSKTSPIKNIETPVNLQVQKTSSGNKVTSNTAYISNKIDYINSITPTKEIVKEAHKALEDAINDMVNLADSVRREDEKENKEKVQEAVEHNLDIARTLSELLQKYWAAAGHHIDTSYLSSVGELEMRVKLVHEGNLKS